MGNIAVPRDATESTNHGESQAIPYESPDDVHPRATKGKYQASPLYETFLTRTTDHPKSSDRFEAPRSSSVASVLSVRLAPPVYYSLKPACLFPLHIKIRQDVIRAMGYVLLEVTRSSCPGQSPRLQQRQVPESAFVWIKVRVPITDLIMGDRRAADRHGRHGLERRAKEAHIMFANGWSP